MGSISEDFIKTGNIFDRTTQNYQSLPFNKDNIFIAPNEFVNEQVINKKLELLHQNFLFLYKLGNYAKFDIPTTQYFAFSGSNLALYNRRLKKALYTKNTNLKESQHGASSFFVNELEGTVVFFTTQTKLYSVIVDVDSVSPLTETTSIDPLSGSIFFRDISDLKIDKQNNLYLVDNGYKNLYFYTIQTVLENESIYRSLPFLKNVVGGPGALSENAKFNNINNIAINDMFVLVEDDVNKCFKLFDKKLNWLNTIKLKSLFEKIQKFDGLAIDNNNFIFGIVGKTLYKFQLESNLNLTLIQEYDVGVYIGVDEKVLSIKVSDIDTNILYIVTNRFIIKVWGTDPSGCIGKFGVGEEIVWGDAFVGRDDDNLIVFKTISNTDKDAIGFYGFYDKLNIETLLTNRDFNIFSYDEIKISSNEYVTSWVFQKAIKKIYYNISKLLKEIKYRLVDENDVTSSIVDRLYNLAFFRYTTPSSEPFNLNIGINEKFQPDVINRGLNEIYVLQLDIMLYILNNLTTKRYLSPAPELAFESAIVYTYFTDNSVVLFPSPARLQPLEEFVPLNGILLSLGGAPYKSGEGISISPGIIT